MCSTANFQCEPATGRDNLSGSGNWGFDSGVGGIGAGAKWGHFVGVAPRLARVAIVLAISSASSGLGAWFEAGEERSLLAMTSTFPAESRRRITPLEARRMALEVLRRAEAERAAAAEAEAERGIDWGEVV